jgi:hypothetical protein
MTITGAVAQAPFTGTMLVFLCAVLYITISEHRRSFNSSRLEKIRESNRIFFRLRLAATVFSTIALFGMFLAPFLSYLTPASCPGTSFYVQLTYSFAKYFVFLFLFEKQRLVQIDKAKLTYFEIFLLLLIHIYLINVLAFTFSLKFSDTTETGYLCVPEPTPPGLFPVVVISFLTLFGAALGLMRLFIKPVEGIATVDKHHDQKNLRNVILLNKQSTIVFIVENFLFTILVAILQEIMPPIEFQTLAGVLLALDTTIAIVSTVMCSPQLWSSFNNLFKSQGLTDADNGKVLIRQSNQNASGGDSKKQSQDIQRPAPPTTQDRSTTTKHETGTAQVDVVSD